ncbi:MAG: DNA alkylation repair protein [Propionibacteriaceae bacterium]|nr:DNA alkylation repair protein [Propionibacteriaceae bacterium]
MTIDSAAALTSEILTTLDGRRDPVRAPQQQAYMKSAMPFYGIPVPQVRDIVRQIAKTHKPDLATVAEASRLLWDGAQYREDRYAAIALTGLSVAKGRLELMELYEYEARTGAWWDFVDEIAHRIADLHDAHPAETATWVRQWAVADTFWLRRLAVLSQLQRRQRTDTELLTEVIEANSASTEFFVAKAIGWALRNYAFTNPGWVRAFVDSHKLAPLSQREALKHVNLTVAID